MVIGIWSDSRFVLVCQLVEMIKDDDANETSGEDGLVLLGNLLGESQLRIPKFEPEIMLSNMLPLVFVELEYHAEWCGLKVTSCARACWEYVDVGDDQLLIKAGDVETNTGPITTNKQVWICDICHKQIRGIESRFP